MYIHEVLDNERVFDAITIDLRALGIKSRVKKNFRKVENSDKCRSNLKKVFNVSLLLQPLDAVKLSTGTVVHAPKFVKQAVSYLNQHIALEGLFRKAGSQSRQRELINRLDSGNELGEKYHPLDVANCLKKYFRDLPEPIIPYAYHDLFVRCGLLKGSKVQAILLACLLLPTSHLNTLAFLMDFLKQVSLHESQNKMSVDNLAKVVGPNIMPLRETTMIAMQNRLEAHLAIVKILIENAEFIGVIPQNIVDTIYHEAHHTSENDITPDDRFKEKKKKHRSGSLTRMFNGLKKIVGKNGSPDDTNSRPERLGQSLIEPPQRSPNKSCKKRKNGESTSQSLQMKKKRNSLDGALLHAPSNRRSVQTTPISSNPDPSDKTPLIQKIKGRKYTSQNDQASSHKTERSTKLGLALDRLITKSRHKINEVENEEEAPANKDVNSPVQRRWSLSSNRTSRATVKKRRAPDPTLAISPSKRVKDLANASNCFDRVYMNAEINLSDENVNITSSRHRRSLGVQSVLDRNIYESTDDSRTSRGRESLEEYIKLPISEYEAIKNRVSLIETQISQEFNNITDRSNESPQVNTASEVQIEYEKTLGEASIGTINSADHLARRLSKELKIRRSAEHKVIRSPSARRISTLRRRSQERPVSARKRIMRTPSWHVSDNYGQVRSNSGGPSSSAATDQFCSESTNSRLDYLHRQLCTLINHTAEHTGDLLDEELSTTKISVRRASSFHGREVTNQSVYSNTRVNDLRKSISQRNMILNNEENSKTVENCDSEISWKDASVYLNSPACRAEVAQTASNQTGRASIAKLRTQNAGMVLAKARLFDHNGSKIDPDVGADLNSKRSVRRGPKDLNTSPRDAGRKKKCKSPKNGVKKSPGDSTVTLTSRSNSDQRNRTPNELSLPANNSGRRTVKTTSIYNGTAVEDPNFMSHLSGLSTINTLSSTPHIKEPLALKTPKSARSLVRRAPIDSRRTPMKAVATALGTPKRQSPRNVLKTRQLSRHVN